MIIGYLGMRAIAMLVCRLKQTANGPFCVNNCLGTLRQRCSGWWLPSLLLTVAWFRGSYHGYNQNESQQSILHQFVNQSEQISINNPWLIHCYWLLNPWLPPPWGLGSKLRERCQAQVPHLAAAQIRALTAVVATMPGNGGNQCHGSLVDPHQ